MSEGGEGGTDEMRQRLKQYLQNKKGAMISSTGASARTTSGKVVKVSRTKPVTAAKVSLRPEIQRTTQEKPPMLAHTGRVSCTKASVPPQPTVNCAGPLDLSQARLRLLHRLVQERPEFAPPVIESVAHFTSVTDVELHRKAMREMSRLLGPVVEWVREAVERLLNLHNRITHEQQVIIYGIGVSSTWPLTRFCRRK